MLSELTQNIEKVVKHLEHEYAKLQVGRANPALVEDIRVESYGDLQPIKNVASVTIMDPQTLKVQPWDKTVMHAIAKAIWETSLGLNPQVWADSILIKIPLMTEEKRKEIAKYAKGLLEDAKVSVRNARQDTLKKIKANDELTEDEQKDLESDIQDDVNKANKSLEEIFTKKEQDIMKV